VFALLRHRGFWNYDIKRAKQIEATQDFGIKHFSEYKKRYEEIGLGLEKSEINEESRFVFNIESRLFWAIIILFLFLAALISSGVCLYLPNEITISKIIISLLVFIIVFVLLCVLCFYKEYKRIKHQK
jgi:magnesium-transporting ATPase (P-type)